MRRPAAVVALSALLALTGACGDEDDGDVASDASSSTTVADESATTSAAADGDDTSTSAAEEDPDDPGTTTGTAEPDGPAGDGDLPGEPIEIFPYEGASLAVIGVAADDTLNVREGPGTDFEVVAELAPLTEGFTATGRNRALDDDAIWVEVETGEVTGWINSAFQAQLGATNDVTSEIPGGLEAATLVALAEQVAAVRAPSEGGPTPRLTVVDGPSVGDLGEVVVDVVGLGDDAQVGERLHVFAVAGASGDGFALRTVEATALCGRGVTDGLCL